MQKIVSWNVNGIRAAEKKGLFKWLQSFAPDVLCIQEIKANKEQLSQDFFPENYEVTFHSAQKAGYSGVAVYIRNGSKWKVKQVGLGIDKFDSEGRFILLEHPEFYLSNAYYPNGQRDHGRVPYKLEFSEEVAKLSKKLEKEKPVMLCGDFNTAHTEIDLANPKGNKKTTGFLPVERDWFQGLIDRGIIDIFRERHPGTEGHYTWWTYRNNCRERNIGWRIDYFMISQSLKARVLDASIHPEVLGSDHCPISITLK